MPKAPSAPNRSSLRIFVRRGAIRRFDKLTAGAKHLDVPVEWDRRAARSGTESAKTSSPADPATERRLEPPSTWTLADFVLVEDGAQGSKDEASVSKPARRSRKTEPKAP